MFDESFSIYGGNVKSTMAGEFSFSIALSFAMLGLGLFARGLETGKYRSWAAIVLALAMLSHGIVLIFVVLGAVLLWLVWMDRTRFVYGLTVLTAAVLLERVLGGAVPRQPRVHDRHEVHGRPDGATDSFWDMFFPWTDVPRHRRHRLRRLRLRRRPSSGATSTARGWASAAWR